MDTLLWVCRALHLFAVVVWCGGLMYQAVVILPVATLDETGGGKTATNQLRRFVPVVWMSAWTMLVTGVALLLFNPRFVFFEYHDAWSVGMGLKQITFLMMMLFGLGYARMLARIDQLKANDGAVASDERTRALVRLHQFHRINVALAIAAILLAAFLT